MRSASCALPGNRDEEADGYINHIVLCPVAKIPSIVPACMSEDVRGGGASVADEDGRIPLA